MIETMTKEELAKIQRKVDSYSFDPSDCETVDELEEALRTHYQYYDRLPRKWHGQTWYEVEQDLITEEELAGPISYWKLGKRKQDED